MRYRIALAAAAAVATITVFAVAVAGFASGADSSTTPRWFEASGATGPNAGSPGPSASPTASTSTSPSAPCTSPAGPGWSCEQQRRFAAAQAFLLTRPGQLGVIVGDRTTGAIWRAGATTSVAWTASTIKVAIVTALLESHRAGQIRLDATDRSNMHAALVASSNDATTALWDRYGGKPMFDRFRATYGMASLSVVPGYELFWRNLRCSAEDLYQLMSYVLARTAPDDRGYLVSELRGVNAEQHWGVWAAGSDLQPGNKDGWAQKPDPGGTHWVTHTVGFAGLAERYVVVATYSLLPSGTLSEGAHAVSDLVATAFGAPVPAKITTP